MNNQDLHRLGVPTGDALKLAYELMRRRFAQGWDRAQVEAEIARVAADPPAFFGDETLAPLARAIHRPRSCRGGAGAVAPVGHGARAGGGQANVQLVRAAGGAGRRAHA